jgi:hypothetical protein
MNEYTVCDMDKVRACFGSGTRRKKIAEKSEVEKCNKKKQVNRTLLEAPVAKFLVPDWGI